MGRPASSSFSASSWHSGAPFPTWVNGADRTHRDRSGTDGPSTHGVLCVVAPQDDALQRFGPSLRWFHQSGIPFHIVEFSLGCPPGTHTAWAPPPSSVLDLVVRCPLEQIPAPVLASYIERATTLTGATGVLTYRHGSDQATGRVLRDVVDEVCGRRGLRIWLRDRATPPAPDAPLRPIKVPPVATGEAASPAGT